MYIVEVTERSDAWRYKDALRQKFYNTRQLFASCSGIANELVIASADMKIDSRIISHLGFAVRVVRPSSRIYS